MTVSDGMPLADTDGMHDLIMYTVGLSGGCAAAQAAKIILPAWETTAGQSLRGGGCNSETQLLSS